MQLRTKLVAACALATGALSVDITPAASHAVQIPSSRPALLRAGHDRIDVNRALRRYSGMVTALGKPNGEGHIYSFQAERLPVGPGYVPNELRGWRLTLLAGQRFASVFEVESNTESEIVVTSRDGPLNGLAVRDFFLVEKIAVERKPPADEPGSKPGT
jgi:hypothetical protein